MAEGNGLVAGGIDGDPARRGPESTAGQAAPRTRGGRRLAVSWPWAAAAAVSVATTALFAPSGLQLLAFLGVIIVSHEAGHFVVARRVGMRPTEFFWGFGPEVLSWSAGGTRFGLRALFLGGYVRLEGMTPRSELPPGFDEAGTYRAASHRARLATIVAGPGVNLVSAQLAFTVAALLGGAGPVQAVARGANRCWLVIAATGQALGALLANLGGYVAAVVDTTDSTEAPVRFLSPVGQAEISSQAIDLGIGASLQWFGVLCCAIGAVNLLPLPPLDGAHGAIAIVEGAVQRVRKDHSVSYDVSRLVPLAYLTIFALVALSVTALIMDLRALA